MQQLSIFVVHVRVNTIVVLTHGLTIVTVVLRAGIITNFERIQLGRPQLVVSHLASSDLAITDLRRY